MPISTFQSALSFFMRILSAHTLEAVLAHVPHRGGVRAALRDEDLESAAFEAYLSDRLVAVLELFVCVALDLYQKVSLAALLLRQSAAEILRRVLHEVPVHEFARYYAPA